MSWGPDKPEGSVLRLEGSALRARGHRWTISVCSVVASDVCCWAQLVLHGSRCYELLLKTAPLVTPDQIYKALERWLANGEQPSTGVHIQSSNELRWPVPSTGRQALAIRTNL